MSFWNISASASAPLVNGVPSGIDNDHGALKAGGSIKDIERFSNYGFYEARIVTIVSGVYGSYVPLSGGVWNGGDQVIRRATTDIAGVPNTVLLTGGSDSANKTPRVKSRTHQDVLLYATAVRNNQWHEYSGVFDPALSMVHSGVWDQTLDADTALDPRGSGTDHAAVITKTKPGTLVYHNGSNLPKVANYPPKTLF